ncbi:MAG: hypothetical protein N3B14_00325 [Thermoleophilia bacterium]|nr:hypothetical protein [Thermoleophilia bacterium]
MSLGQVPDVAVKVREHDDTRLDQEIARVAAELREDRAEAVLLNVASGGSWGRSAACESSVNYGPDIRVW